MSKSTPLTQLPATQQPHQFVNEQQKHMVTQAQQATQSFALPQNTQSSNDVHVDDDATIQEVLNELNIKSMDNVPSTPQPQQQMPIRQQEQQQQQLQQQQLQQQQQQQYEIEPAEPVYTQPSTSINQQIPYPSDKVYPNTMINDIIEMGVDDTKQPINVTEQPPIDMKQVETTDNVLSKLYSVVLKDVKFIVVIVISFLIIQLAPVDRFVYTYIASIEKIPYSNIIIKSLLAGFVAYILLKLVQMGG